VVLILAALLATIVIHVGIAMAYDGGGTSDVPAASTTDVTAPAEDPCGNAEDPFTGPDFQEIGEPGDGPGTGAASPEDNLRARL
jgi:hypothetical protein